MARCETIFKRDETVRTCVTTVCPVTTGAVQLWSSVGETEHFRQTMNSKSAHVGV